MKFAKDDIVKLQAKPDWGLGKVLEDSSDEIVRIYFVEAGEKKLSLVYAKLEKIEGDEANHPKLANLKISAKTKRDTTGKPAKSSLNLHSMIEVFLNRFPDGFDDSNYYENERGYKVTACQQFQHHLSKTDFTTRLVNNKYDDICQDALKIITSINKETEFISRFEISSLNSGLKKDANKKLFSESLYTFLYDTEKPEDGFEAFCETLAAMNAAKWPVATYFGFIAFPKEQMFLKPDVTKKAANACDFELNYQTEPNRLTYRKLLEFSHFLFKQLKDLNPKDMIDVQSFIWSAIKLDEGKY